MANYFDWQMIYDKFVDLNKILISDLRVYSKIKSKAIIIQKRVKYCLHSYFGFKIGKN